jgi:integrase/recombinase XerD
MKDEQKYLPHFTIDMVSGDAPKKKLFAQSDLDILLKKPASTDDMAFVEWRNWAVVNLAYDMGARAGSIVAICMEDIDLKQGTIYLRHVKNKALAVMKISSACIKALKEYINNWRQGAQPQEPLFCNVGGGALTYNALAHSFTTYCKNRGVNQYNLHGLRHSFATAFAQNSNGDMVKLQRALGHKSITMSQHYVDTASVTLEDYDALSPLEKKKSKAGAPTRAIRKAG